MENRVEKRKTFWPYGIVISIILIFCACIATIVISLDYPVHMDNYYLNSYQNVDRHYNEIQISQQKFEQKYDVKFAEHSAKIGEEFALSLDISAKNSASLDGIKSEILLTRPETNEFNKNLKTTLSNSAITTENLSLDRPGRWQIMVKLSDGLDTGFYKFEFLIHK